PARPRRNAARRCPAGAPRGRATAAGVPRRQTSPAPRGLTGGGRPPPPPPRAVRRPLPRPPGPRRRRPRPAPPPPPALAGPPPSRTLPERGYHLAKLQLSLACGLYDRTLPLLDGAAAPDGIDLNFLSVPPGELFRRQARHAEFDVSEFSLSTYAMLQARGD